MHKIIIILLLCTSFSGAKEAYILEHLSYAKFNEQNCGVPIEITLAQALLESGGGVSSVARTKNNHFGIKQGKQYMEFKSVIECYEYHAAFMHQHYINAVGKPCDYWTKHCRGYGGKDYWHHVQKHIDYYNLKKYRNFYTWY